MDFVNFDEAIKRLGISSERLNQLREDGELRAYRDGSSWKFRADEIDRLSSEGVPDVPPPSDIGLPRLDELVDARELGDLPSLDDDEMKLADDQSELELELDLDDTVTASADDAKSAMHEPASDEPSDPSDSILLTDETLGDLAPSAPSTIIGKSELEAKDADLELVTDDEDLDAATDVRQSAGASNVLTGGIAGSGVLDDIAKESSHARAFEKLEELEIDLAAESSRVLNPAEAADLKEKVAKAAKKPTPPDSDLALADLGMAADDEGTDPVPAELEAKGDKGKSDSKKAASSDLELATDEDDFVLADAGGSDITLDSADSGINLIDPSDSGLALDDIPLEAGGSAILDSLSRGPLDAAESELSLVGGDDAGGLQTDDDFRLTPLGDGDDEGDSSSQVIALGDGLEELGAVGGADEGLLSEDAFSEAEAGGGELADDYQDVGGEFAGAGYGAVAARPDAEYSVWNIVGLGSATLLLLLAAMVTMDLIRNVWSWDQNLPLNDSLLDGLLGLFGLR